MKSLIILASSFFLLALSSVQVQAQSSDENGRQRIALTPFIPENVEALTPQSRDVLSNKLGQIVTKNGLGSSEFNSRFIISANVVVVDKHALPGAPPRYALDLDVTLYIGDGFEGQSFASHNMSIKGVDRSEARAFNAAMRNIKPSNDAVQKFVEEGKQKIIDYYNNNCDVILKNAQALEMQNRFEEALFVLTAIPDACDDCYAKALNAIQPVFQKFIDRECKLRLQEARTIWNASLDRAAADRAGAILATIEPTAACYGDVLKFTKEIGERVYKLDGREWEYILKDQEQESERIEAARAIGVAFGNGQPDTVIYRSLW